MGREIKFRGKRVDTDEFVFGYYVKALASELGITDIPLAAARICHVIVVNGEFFHIKPETLGQYIGKKSKNGFLIYEGDITRDHVGVGFVEYMEEVGAFRINYFNSNWAKWFIDFSLRGENDSIEVIGNIHENKNLMGLN